MRNQFCVLLENTDGLRIATINTHCLLASFAACFLCRRARDGAVVTALAFHQCGPPSNPGIEFVVGSLPLSPLLLEVFRQVLRFSPLLENQHFHPISNSIWNAQTRFNAFLRTPKCPVGKQITITKQFTKFTI